MKKNQFQMKKFWLTKEKILMKKMLISLEKEIGKLTNLFE